MQFWLKYSLNILSPAIIADFCLKNDSFLVQASSIAVNGINQTLYNANSVLQPNTHYGKSKLLAENLIFESGCGSAVLRFGGIFGSNGPSHLGINKAIINAKKEAPSKTDEKIPVETEKETSLSKSKKKIETKKKEEINLN